MSVENTLLESYLKQLNLTTFLRHYQSFAEDAAQSNQGYLRFLLALAEAEVKQRDLNSQRRRLQEARFPVHKTFQDFDFSAIPSLNQQRLLHLAQGDYIAKTEPIILLGNPGLGKTHTAIALGIAATQQKKRVRFFNAAALVNDLLATQQAQRLSPFLDTLLRYHLIILDELGFIPFSPTGSHLLFQFCSTLYERVALIVTTNLKFADWTQLFGDERLTLALIDRLTHRAHLIEFTGDSYRFRQRLAQEER
ncbi:MAG: IS21-like element helper ATPase IstB [Chloroflexota bacterium]